MLATQLRHQEPVEDLEIGEGLREGQGVFLGEDDRPGGAGGREESSDSVLES